MTEPRPLPDELVMAPANAPLTAGICPPPSPDDAPC